MTARHRLHKWWLGSRNAWWNTTIPIWGVVLLLLAAFAAGLLAAQLYLQAGQP